ncbi:hypothetical protein L0B53_14235 [Vibrio sp. SS-MA-C1-2]|uniref:hypothetical protein n=1 Tax=Vibrio sp. SS-MA-C1-2 TaxID=2908646 RepID=UPI001F42E3A6|nr:hypothetical protein [Vibrio sp. SS-MA-C1-2]UJF18168.1 hypothetical protein L0B53_14235 [Vibrio sp. SS-MA-C1-2]
MKSQPSSSGNVTKTSERNKFLIILFIILPVLALSVIGVWSIVEFIIQHNAIS